MPGSDGGGGPLEQRKKEEKGYQGEKKMQKTPHGAQGAVVDMYIYIYKYKFISCRIMPPLLAQVTRRCTDSCLVSFQKSLLIGGC